MPRPLVITRPATTLDDVMAVLHQVVAEQRDQRALLEKLLPAVPPPCKEITVAEAAIAAGRTERCIRTWCGPPLKIGIRTPRGWKVNRDSLIAVLIDRFGRDRLPVALR